MTWETCSFFMGIACMEEGIRISIACMEEGIRVGGLG